MAFLNAQERENLRNELKNLSFGAAKFKLHRLDKKGRLAYIRNNQRTGQWMTRFELDGLGTRVTLIERYEPTERGGKLHAQFELLDVVVEPTPDNRT